MKKFITLAALPAALFAGIVLAQQANPESVRASLQAAGYAEVRDIEFDSGLWEAEVRRADGRWGEIAFDPASNEVFDAKNGRAVLDARADGNGRGEMPLTSGRHDRHDEEQRAGRQRVDDLAEEVVRRTQRVRAHAVRDGRFGAGAAGRLQPPGARAVAAGLPARP